MGHGNGVLGLAGRSGRNLDLAGVELASGRAEGQDGHVWEGGVAVLIADDEDWPSLAFLGPDNRFQIGKDNRPAPNPRLLVVICRVLVRIAEWRRRGDRQLDAEAGSAVGGKLDGDPASV